MIKIFLYFIVIFSSQLTCSASETEYKDEDVCRNFTNNMHQKLFLENLSADIYYGRQNRRNTSLQQQEYFSILMEYMQFKNLSAESINSLIISYEKQYTGLSDKWKETFLTPPSIPLALKKMCLFTVNENPALLIDAALPEELKDEIEKLKNSFQPTNFSKPVETDCCIQ